MPKVRLNDRLHALLFVSFSVTNEADVSRATGQIVFVSDEAEFEMIEEPVLENLHDVDEYLPIPDKRDLHLGNRLAFEFTQQYLPDRYDEVRSMFRKRGAYARFKPCAWCATRLLPLAC
jgi:hypothetical protein